MTTHASMRVLVRHLSLCLTAFAIVPLSGCTSARPDLRVEDSITQASLLDVPLTFRVEGAPVDEPFDQETLSFADATRLAITTDTGLQASLAKVRIAMADADQSRLLPNPVLNFVLRWGPGSPQIEVSLAQNLIQVLQLERQASAADNRMREVAADALAEALDIVSEVQERYLAAQAMDRRVPALMQQAALIDQLSGIAESRFELGEGTRSDLTTLQAQKVQLENEIATAVENQRVQRVRLARLIGEPSSSAEWALDDWFAPETVVLSERVWIETALVHRPEVQSMNWKLAALGDDYALTRLMPWEGAELGMDAQSDSDWFAGPAISTPIPLFDQGKARKARVNSEIIEARHKLTSSMREIVEEVRLSYLNLSANSAQLDRVRGKLIPLLRERLEQSERAYSAGLVSITEPFLAEQDLREMEMHAIEMERQVSVSLVRLQRSVGGPAVAASIVATP